MASIPISRPKIFAATAAVTVSIVIGASTSAFAEKCRGSWGGQAATTIEFKGGKKIKYCYQARCWNETFTGSKSGKLEFPVGNQGARVWLTKSGAKSYKAKYRWGNDRSATTYRCK